MHYIALGVVVLVLLIVVLNPKRWRRLSNSARHFRKDVEEGVDEDLSLESGEDDRT